MANATLRYQKVGAHGLRPFRSMANATLRYQKVGAQGLRPFGSMANATLRYQEDLEEVISNIKSGKLSDF